MLEEDAKTSMSHDEDIFTLNVDGEAPEEEMECELEDDTVQDPERVRTISNPGQPSKKEREEHEATHAKHRSWCISCGRGRGIAMTHHRSTGARGDEGKVAHIRDGLLFPITRQSARNHNVGHQGNQDQGDQYVHGPEQKVPMNILFKAVVDFMSACGCGHAIHKGDSRTGDCCSSGCSEEFKTE